jgi:Glycosyl transferase family 2
MPKENSAAGIAPAQVQLEVPRFGEFARQYAGVCSRDIVRCLASQTARGGRIGRHLVRAGLITSEQVAEILCRQARWAARMRSHDIAPHRFPISTPISLCMPCYNEGEVIEDVLRGALAVLPEFVDEFEILVVDDGSRDDTAPIVSRMAAEDDRIRLVRHQVNRGYGAAFATALREAHGQWICFTDGDGQFNLLDLPQLLVEAQSADVVVGYRHRRADNGLRRFNARGWKLLMRGLVGIRVRDLDCAFKLFPRWVVEQLQLTADGACISAEILAQCTRGGLVVTEVPVNHFPRAAGKATGANLRVVAKAFREIPIVWKYRRMRPWEVDRLRLGTGQTGAAAVRRAVDSLPSQEESEYAGQLDENCAPAGEF